MTALPSTPIPDVFTPVGLLPSSFDLSAVSNCRSLSSPCKEEFLALSTFKEPEDFKKLRCSSKVTLYTKPPTPFWTLGSSSSPTSSFSSLPPTFTPPPTFTLLIRSKKHKDEVVIQKHQEKQKKITQKERDDIELAELNWRYAHERSRSQLQGDKEHTEEKKEETDEEEKEDEEEDDEDGRKKKRK